MHLQYPFIAGLWFGFGLRAALFHDEPQEALIVLDYPVPGWFFRLWVFACTTIFGPLGYAIGLGVSLYRRWRYRTRLS